MYVICDDLAAYCNAACDTTPLLGSTDGVKTSNGLKLSLGTIFLRCIYCKKKHQTKHKKKCERRVAETQSWSARKMCWKYG